MTDRRMKQKKMASFRPRVELLFSENYLALLRRVYVFSALDTIWAATLVNRLACKCVDSNFIWFSVLKGLANFDRKSPLKYIKASMLHKLHRLHKIGAKARTMLNEGTRRQINDTDDPQFWKACVHRAINNILFDYRLEIACYPGDLHGAGLDTSHPILLFVKGKIIKVIVTSCIL